MEFAFVCGPIFLLPLAKYKMQVIDIDCLEFTV